MLKLRPIGPHDYSVFEDEQRIGRIRFAGERQPGVWLCSRCTEKITGPKKIHAS
jgi:hypothetical protein